MKAKDARPLQQKISAGRAQLGQLRDAHRAAVETHRTLEARHAVLAGQTGTVSQSDLAASLGAVRTAAAAVQTAQATLDAFATGFNDVLVEMHHIPPQQAVEACDDRFPFLLLPVRLECRFESDSLSLKIRIFPDRPAIDNLDELLTVEELESAETFWNEIWRAGGVKSGELAAWRALVQAHGGNRAAWIARRHSPTNERRADGSSNRPIQPVAAERRLVPQPIFPPATGQLLSWSRAPQAIGLPERFVAIGYVQGQRVFEVAGSRIPETLMTGPDPLSTDDGAAAASAADLPAVDPGMRWMVDFDEAVRVGMAMRISLPPAARNGLDELVVLGLRTSTDAAEGAALAETMFRTHLYGPDGFAFVPQGTPTNDTGPPAPPGEALASVDALYEREFRPGPLSTSEDWIDKTDGRHFATALGIDPHLVRPAANSGAMDQADARAMNIALWPATLRPFFEEMMNPLLSRDTIKSVQRLFQAHVSGRGPVPTIRIGDQPYGIVVTSAVSRWTPEPVRNPLTGGLSPDPFRTGLRDLLGRLDGIWGQLAAGVPVLGEGQDSQAVLLDVLGLQPRSAEIYQRFATGLDQLAYAQSLNGLGSTNQALSKIMKAKSQAVLEALGIDPAKIPEIYRRIFYDSANRLAGPLVDAARLSETAALAKIGNTNQNYVGWLATQGVDAIRREDFGTVGGKAVAPPRTLLYLLLRNAALSGYWDASWRFYESAGQATQIARLDPAMSNVQQGVATQSKYQLLYADSGPLAAAYPDMFRAGRTIAESFDVTQWSLRPETEDLWAARRACNWLSGRPTAKLDRAFREHIDLCSYRFDAWRLALVNERLHELRSRPASKRGLYLGAFGYLHKLKPRTPSQPYARSLPAGLTPTAPGAVVTEQVGAEYLLAPSLNHAVTAAVLRSAYLTHAGPDRPAAMSIDISSARVRAALDLLDGVRSGQGLAELLGYKFERGLHDSHAQGEVDKYIYPLRRRFPLASGGQGPIPPGTAIQAVEARNVLDGLALVRHIQASGKRNYPFGFTDLPAISSSNPAQVKEAAAIDAQAARLIDMLDGVADLMLSEGAYSAAMGNLERAGAALDALSGTANLPEPEIVRTRRGGHGVTHRLCLLLPAAAPPPDSSESGPTPRPTPTLSPRARMEPELNAWLKGLFGDLRTVMYRAGWTRRRQPEQQDFTLADLGIEPIDLLYIAEPSANAAAGELDRRIELTVRRIQQLREQVEIRIAYAEPVPGSITLFELLPMIRAAKGLLLGRPPLGARHFAPPSWPAAPDNPNRWRARDYEARLEAALDALSLLRGALQHAGPPLESASRTPAHFNRMRDLLTAAAGYGIIGALPETSNGTDPAMAVALLGQAQRVDVAIAERLAAAAAARARSAGLNEDRRVAACTAAVKAVFGADFVSLPGFLLDSPDEMNRSAADRSALMRQAEAADPFPLETWLAGIARVRPAPAHLERIVTLAPALGRAEPDLVPLQLPHRPGDHWLGAELPTGYEFGTDSLLATTILAGGGKLETARAGLLLDEWTEVIPAKEQTAAIAFRYDGPDSEPPQALLLAVSPDLSGAWAWDDLVDTVRETVQLARHRAVEPRQIDQSELAQLLPAIMIPFTAAGTTLSPNIAAVIALAAEE